MWDYIHSDEDTLWSESIDPTFDVCSFEFCLPSQQVESWVQNPDRDCAFLVSAARKASSEVQFSKLSSQEKEAFQKAKEKELMCWLDTSTVRKILRTRIHPDRIMSSRWILTYKPDPSSEKGYKHKARLVVKGFQDPEIDSVSTDSPTLTRDGRMVLLQVVSSMHWQVQSFDITTAFLRGKGDGRQLAMDPVPELRKLMNLQDDEVCLLEGNAYGRVDAPLLFYKEFRSQLEKVGFEAHPLDGCLYLLRNPKTGELDGILGTHVDDGIGGGIIDLKKPSKRYQRCFRSVPMIDRAFVSQGLILNSYRTIPSESIKGSISIRFLQSMFQKFVEVIVKVVQHLLKSNNCELFAAHSNMQQ